MYQGYEYYPYAQYQSWPNPIKPRPRVFGGLFGRGRNLNIMQTPKFNWSEFLSNTQKTLNVVNQAIPIFYQIKPIWNNAKTMFRIMGAIKEDDIEENKHTSSANDDTFTVANNTNTSNKPQFFL